jgi:TPR repeat protein
VSEPAKLPARDAVPEAPIAPQQPAKAKSEPAAEPPAAPNSSNSVRALQPDEIRLLVEQGEKFAGAGDIVTARMLFERAAKAGDAAAALALAATYDPVVLARVGVLGMDTDVEKARLWYQKAESLGSTQAAARLNALATR